jgi:hypothetical protein
MILKGEYMPGDVISINASNSDLVFVPVERVQQAG